MKEQIRLDRLRGAGFQKTAAGRRHRRPAAPLYNHSVMKSVATAKSSRWARLPPAVVLPKLAFASIPFRGAAL